MIRKFQPSDLDEVMTIWLGSNLDAHDFIPSTYWTENYDAVKTLIPNAEVYVVEQDNAVAAFVGLTEDLIAGLFVRADRRSQGLGAALLTYVKNRKTSLTLHVYKKNPRAVEFYQREGFVIQGNSLDENGETEYIMTWKKLLT